VFYFVVELMKQKTSIFIFVLNLFSVLSITQ